MGFETWIDYGYGIDLSDFNIDRRDSDRLLKLVGLAPKFGADITDELKQKEDYAELTSEEKVGIIISESEGYEYSKCGIAGVLANVIEECEGITIAGLPDYNGNEYLIYQPSYPWDKLPPNEHGITRAKIKEIISKYISVISDTPITDDLFNFQSVENCG